MTGKGFDSKLFRSILALLSGNSVATAIGFLVYPLLTRIYTSGDFGTYGIFSSTCGILTLLANAEYHNAIMLPKSRRDSAACFHLSMICTLGVCAIAALLSVLACCAVDSDLNRIGCTALLVAPYVFICALWNALNSWYTKAAEFKKVAVCQISQATTMSLLKMVFGYVRMPFNGMSLAILLGQSAAIAHNLLTSVGVVRELLRIDWARCRKCLSRYAKFPLLSLPRSFVNYLSGNLPFFLLPFFFSNDNIGFFSLSVALAFRPVNVISTSLHQVFFQKSAAMVNEKKRLMPFFRKYSATTLSVALPVLAVVYFATPSLVGLLLGEGWERTGEFVRMMLPWLCASVLVAPICYFTDLFLRQREGLWIELALLAARFAGLYCGIAAGDFDTAIALYCAASAAVVLLNYAWLFHIVRRYDCELPDEKC